LTEENCHEKIIAVSSTTDSIWVNRIEAWWNGDDQLSDNCIDKVNSFHCRISFDYADEGNLLVNTCQTIYLLCDGIDQIVWWKCGRIANESWSNSYANRSDVRCGDEIIVSMSFTSRRRYYFDGTSAYVCIDHNRIKQYDIQISKQLQFWLIKSLLVLLLDKLISL
jgi:hypothetical protein